MKFKKILSIALCVTFLAGQIPSNVFATESDSIASLSSSLVEKKYSDSTVSAFKLKDSSFNIDTTKNQLSDSVGHKFTEKRSGNNVRMYNSNSNYPIGFASFESNSRDDSDSGWNQWSRWKVSGDEKSLLSKLLATDGNLEVGGKYDGHIDTQASVVKGHAYMNIEQNHIDESDNATVITSRETKMGDSDPKDTLVTKAVDFQKVDQKTNAFYVNVGGTKGHWFGADKNYAEVHHPQVFFRDVLSPRIDSVEIEGGTEYSGYENFVNGDKIRIKLIFSEPIRCVGSYEDAFYISADGFKDIVAVEYNEVDYEKAQLCFEATVIDSPNCRNFSGSFSASARPVSGKVKDLAGNIMADDPKSSVRDDILIDGYLPRINQAYIESVISKDDSGNYTEIKNQKTIIKTDDYIVFRVSFNQVMKQSGKTVSTFPVEVEGVGMRNAYVRTVYKGGNVVNTISDSEARSYAINGEFDAVSYIFQVPSEAADGARIRFPATKTQITIDGTQKTYWTMEDYVGSLVSTYGNVNIKASSKRKPLQDRTEILAVEGEDSVFEMVVDKTAPTLSLTDVNGKAVPGIFDTPEKADIKTEKSNDFRVYFKADEEVNGSVKAELKFIHKENPMDEVVVATEYCGAYMNDNIIEDMCLDFTVPKALEIDSADYDIFIETTVFDEIYNKNVQRFYLAADTRPPELKITNGNGRGELVVEGDVSYWLYKFDVNDHSTPENARLYYRFSSDEDFRFTDQSSDFTVKTSESPLGSGSSGTIQYYAGDIIGNDTEVHTQNYYISDLRSCELLDPENVSAYLPGRDVWFTGFKAPSEENAGTVYDFLVYSIDGGEYKFVQSKEGENLCIPAKELYNNCIISYKLVRCTEDDFHTDFYGEVYSAVYHCDDVPPEVASSVILDEGGNASSVRILAPFDSHPKNMQSAQIMLSCGDYNVTIEGDEYIKNGVFYANLNLYDILRENSMPSGYYEIITIVVDSNGHTGTNIISRNIIVDAPEMTNIRIYSAHDTPFESGDGYMGYGADAQNRASVTASRVNQLIHSGIPFTRKADEYRVEVDLRMRYEGSEYPRLDEEDVWYTLSEDGGRSWTQYSQADIASNVASIETIDGKNYAVYKVNVNLPKNNSDGTKEYYLRLKCGGNPQGSDIAVVETKTDITAPQSVFHIDSVGSDENGWSEDVTYTTEYVKYRYAGVDKDGFMGTATIHQIQKIVDKEGNEVEPGDYQQYLKIIETGDTLDYIIVKQRCRIFAQIADLWGNSVDTSFECLLIDDVEPEYFIYNENTDEFTYAVVANIADVAFGAVSPGTLKMTDDAKNTYRNLIDDDALVCESMGSRASAIRGKKMEVFRLNQAKLSDSDYDIIATIYDTDGAEIDTFKIMSVKSSAPDITLVSTSNTSSGLGKTVRAAETMQFNLPVAQITGEAAKLLEKEGLEAASGIYKGDLVFSETLNAVLDVESGNSVYVIDRLARAAKIEVNTEGTEFIKFKTYDVAYANINDMGTNVCDKNYIYGSASGIKITINGYTGAAIKPELPEGFVIGEDSQPDVSGSEYEGYYSEVSIEAPAGFAKSEGTMIIRYTVKNRTNLEEYGDVLVVNTDNRAPVLLDAVQMRRTDIYSPKTVFYMFYDRYGVGSVSTDVGNGFETNNAANGIAIAQYYSNCAPVVRAVDNNGNATDYVDDTINDITVSHSLVEGRDYMIEITDSDMNPAVAGQYYKAVYINPVSIDGGKYFETLARYPLYTDSEEEIIIELVDENGEKVMHRLNPPVDITAPKISAYQNNSGDYVEELRFTISVSDMRSGIERVYVENAGENGEDVELSAIDGDSVYKYYEYIANHAGEFKVVAIDAVGNRSEHVITSNSSIVGPLEVYANQSVTGKTNKNVIMSMYSSDGRRIYTRIPEEQPEGYLELGDYIQSGNDIAFVKNGYLIVECVDDMANSVTKLISVSNIDKTPATVQATVSAVLRDDGTISPSRAKVTFAADADDDRIGAVHLLYVERSEAQADSEIDVESLKKQWEEYIKDSTNFVLTEEFKEVFEKLYKLDIKDPTTYVEVGKNGEHTFYFMDDAGNISTTVANVSVIDDTAPVITKISYGFNTSSMLMAETHVSGEFDLNSNVITISKDSTGFLTNQPVTVMVTSDEPTRVFGSNSTVYDTSVSTSFVRNGIYDLIIEDEAGNRTQKTIDVSNILKREIFMSFGQNEIVVFKGQEKDYDFSIINDYEVYTYNGNDEKVTLIADTDYKSSVDLGRFNINDISANVFDRNAPYIITYKASDIAGNYVERTRQIILADNTDVFVMVNGEVPNVASCVYTSDSLLNISVANYGSKAVVKVAEGQLNGAQMKQIPGELTIGDDGMYHYEAKTKGWHTVGVRTLFQDNYVVWVYVG